MKYRLAVAVFALFAVACGSSGGGGTPGEVASGPAASITTVSLAVASTTTGLDEVTETMAVAESLTVRAVEHAFGTTEVPNSPERILILDAGTILPVLLFLGVENIIGAPLPDGPINATRLLSNFDLDGIESIGFPDENPELMAAMRPDLIIGFDSGLQETFDVYSQIAPTVAVERDLTDWRSSGVRIAAAVGREAEMIEELAAYDARVADLQAVIGDPAGVETTIVRALGPLIRLHTRFHFAGQVFDDVGFSWPSAVPADDPGIRYVQLSLEELGLADADHLFVFGAGANPDGSDVDGTIQAILDHPLYSTLGAAESGNVHVVDPLAWQQGGVAAANMILDDLEGVFP